VQFGDSAGGFTALRAGGREAFDGQSNAGAGELYGGLRKLVWLVLKRLKLAF